MKAHDFFLYAQEVYKKEYKLVLNLLMKNSNLTRFSSNENKVPILFFKKDSIHIWHQDTSVSQYPFVFSQPEEIFFIVQQHIFDANTIYISKNLPEVFCEDFIKNKVNKSLEENNEEEFKYWRSFLPK